MRTRKTDFKPGQLLKIVEATFHDYSVETIVKVINSDWHSYHVVNISGSMRFWWVNENQVRPLKMLRYDNILIFAHALTIKFGHSTPFLLNSGAGWKTRKLWQQCQIWKSRQRKFKFGNIDIL